MKRTFSIVKRNKKGQSLKTKLLIDGKPVPKGKKYCNGCKTIKFAKTDFTPCGNSCKICANKRARKDYKKRMENPVWRENRRRTQKEKARQGKRKIVDFLGRKCNTCGGVFPDAVYDLHHVDRENKEFNISDMRKLSWTKQKKELRKCILLCANCHRIETFPDESIN